MSREQKVWRQRSGAYSLLEMLVVMVLIAILASLATPPLYRMLTSQALTVASREVSNHLVLARSTAIAKHTLTRFVVATQWAKTDGILRKYSIWSWDVETSQFLQDTPWFSLEQGTVFEPLAAAYLAKSAYAENDATTVQGHFALNHLEAASTATDFNGETVSTQFVEFLPTGAARIPGGTLKNIIFVLIEGYFEDGDAGPGLIRIGTRTPGIPENWAQINLETLTGRVRIYRP